MQLSHRVDDILLELLNTEQNYVNDLLLFKNVFIDKVAEGARLRSGPLCRFAQQPIVVKFVNTFQQIYFIHNTFLERFTYLFQHSNIPCQEISQLFIDSMPPIRLYYSKYARLYQGFLSTLKAFIRPSPSSVGEVLFDFIISNSPNKSNQNDTPFGAFVRTINREKLHERGISAFLILPIQRIPRYVLLLENILACPDISPESLSTTQRAHECTRHCLKHIDHRMKKKSEINAENHSESDDNNVNLLQFPSLDSLSDIVKAHLSYFSENQ